MIESYVVQFGALGIVAYIVWAQQEEKLKDKALLVEVIRNNTKALINVDKSINFCKKNKNN